MKKMNICRGPLWIREVLGETAVCDLARQLYVFDFHALYVASVVVGCDLIALLKPTHFLVLHPKFAVV